MPTLTQVRNVVDSRLANLWTNQVLPREAIYLGNHGHYWQGIVTGDPTLIPNNTAGATDAVEFAPNLSAKPTDQAEDWAAAGLSLEATLPFALAIDVYDGPQGQGFVGHVWVRWSGNLYHRAQNSGPETWRTQAWHVVQA